ncbi:phosphatidate cytidylyltransferase [Actinomyces lilanjuaniae]|uniref:Phosphatidate cytidylyltransferase n=1 Tax=Actinomyces lilanjuaniae TaxID=2321394 RepID=A0ABN5PPI1_9ACTO|nr:phosphatidate cytidylyltransferase [Actinomyces lilanjuaniae]
MGVVSTLLTPPPTRDRAPLPATGRAGRNLPAAVGVAVVLVVLVAGSLLFYRELFVLLAVVAVCSALWEMAGALARKRIRLPLAPLWLGTLGTAVCAWQVGAEAAFGAYVATSGACVLWCFMDQAEADTGTPLEESGNAVPRSDLHDMVRRSRSRSAAASVFAATYLPFLASFAVLVAAQEEGAQRVMMMIALPAASDTGGWLVGVLLGRHPMAPRCLPGSPGRVHRLPGGLGRSGCGDPAPPGRPCMGGRGPGACVVVVSTLGDLGSRCSSVTWV